MGSIANQLMSRAPQRLDHVRLTPQLSFENEAIVVASDVHIPNTNEMLVEQMYKRALRENAAVLFLMGDLYNNAQFSRHPPGRSSILEHWESSRDMAHDFIALMCEVFTSIYIFPGNHDQWWIKFNKAELGMIDLMRLTFPEGGEYRGGYGVVDNTAIQVYELPSCYLTVNNQQWYLTHPGQYSKITGRVAENFIIKEDCNVGVAHLHQFGMHLFKGKWALSLGGLYDQKYFDYIYDRPKASAPMEPGFVILGKGDTPILVRPEN